MKKIRLYLPKKFQICYEYKILNSEDKRLIIRSKSEHLALNMRSGMRFYTLYNRIILPLISF